MEYDAKTFFTEHEADSVNGFVVINAENGRYQIAEKWLKDDGEDRWISYVVPESDLLARVESEACEPKGHVSDDQYEAVCKKAGVPTAEKAEA